MKSHTHLVTFPSISEAILLGGRDFNIPKDLIKLIFSFLVKKCASPAAVRGVLAIKMAAKLLGTFWTPYAIKKKGITKLIIPIAANQYQSFEKASILIFLKKQSPITGIAPNNILRNAIVTGPYEYVAILILKKADAQIRASTTRKI